MDLGANDDQCDFPVVYASGVKGIAGTSPDSMQEDLQPLFEMIVNSVRACCLGGGGGRVCGLRVEGGHCEVSAHCTDEANLFRRCREARLA